MGERNNSSFRPQDYFQRLTKALEFAVSEWLLMFLLFIDACFAYLITEFASYRQLQSPCPLCSRLDHVLAKNRPEFYWDLICHNHKSEISSLCGVYNKLIDIHGTCDDHKPDVVERDASSLFKNPADNEKSIFVDETLGSFRSSEMGKTRIDPLLDAEYLKVNVTSDTESEIPVSNDDCVRARVSKAQHVQVEVVDRHHVATETAEAAARDLEELKWRHMSQSQMSELISFDDVESSNVAETPVKVLVETSDDPRTGEKIKNPVSDNEPISKPESELIIASNGPQMLNYLDLGDAYKLAISSKGRQLSGKLFDQKSFQDSSTRVSEDLKLLLSHKSSFQGVEFSSNDNLISPKLSLNSDECKAFDSAMSMGMQLLQRRMSLERNESNVLLEGSVMSEIDGENAVDRLRRQVEHDKKLMGALYKELEEERNASAVATNQAMAMITRLQEEKAALYTEASQYLRMMEEQAEYNSEALQKANELIEEKEKEIEDLENEIEILRKTSEDVMFPSLQS